MKTNYKILFEKELDTVRIFDKKPRLLLHVCCAPCSSAVLECLLPYFDITIYFYNPNIFPESEYNFRFLELQRMLDKMGLKDIITICVEYDNKEFEAIAKGKEALPEGGGRCFDCYRLRLEKSVEFASEHKFDYVTTTLTVSPHKNAEVLNQIGGEIAEKHNVKYLFSDFKKNEGYKRSCQLSSEYNLYRQNYCGCIYSKKNAEKTHPIE